MNDLCTCTNSVGSGVLDSYRFKDKTSLTSQPILTHEN